MHRIKKSENIGIMYREWKAERPKAVLLLVHGLSASTERWDFLGNFFAGHSISSYALELRGFGKTAEARGDIASFNIYIQDVLGLYRIIRKSHKTQKVFLIGESMGALVSFMAACSGAGIFDGLVCMSPAFKSRLKFSLYTYMDIALSYFFYPHKYFLMPFNPNMCTRDEKYRKTMDVSSAKNRLVTAKMLSEIFFAQKKIGFIAGRLRMPVLFLTAGRDRIASTEAAKAVFDGIGSTDKEIVVYPEMYHSLSVELDREKVFQDVLDWVLKRI